MSLQKVSDGLYTIVFVWLISSSVSFGQQKILRSVIPRSVFTFRYGENIKKNKLSIKKGTYIHITNYNP